MFVLLSVLVVVACVQDASSQRFCKVDNDAGVQYCFEPGYINGLRRCNSYEPEDVIVRPGCSGPNRYSNQSLAPKRCVDGEWVDVFSCTPATSTALSTTTIAAADNPSTGVFATPAPPPRGPSQDDNNNKQCGKVVFNTPPVPLNGSTPTLEGQWPWHVALHRVKSPYKHQYKCGGTLVSHKHVITVAYCVLEPGNVTIIEPNKLFVSLGIHNLKTSVDGGEIQSVGGWGLDDTGELIEELSVVEIPVVHTVTCIRSNFAFFTGQYSTWDDVFCAGLRDKTYPQLCVRGIGNGLMFKNDNSWYLRGSLARIAVMKDHNICDPTEYAVFTDVAKFVPWIKQIVTDF